MKELSNDLLRAIDLGELALQKITDAESCEPVLRGGWSRKQVIGHLIDSASNNHQRFVRASLQNTLEFPAYDQDGCVRVQAVQEANWQQLLSLWLAYNRYLAHVIGHLPPNKLEVLCCIGTAEPVTLRFLATDYLAHLLHHLRQIGAADTPQA
ncbi:MAG: DinB family protein [Candidatus Acidiferrales bacterium]